MRSGKAYDYIIAGAGSAGCTLAARLAEDPDVTVLLVEAGGDGKGLFVRMPAGNGFLFGNPEYDWGFGSEAQPGLNGRRIYYPRGRGVGGSSLLNGMVYIRGNARDFGRWRACGLDGWGYADVLPYFKRSEAAPHRDPLYHGHTGPLIDPAYFQHPKDVEDLVAGVRHMREIAGQDALQKLLAAELSPGINVRDDTGLAAAVRGLATTGHHPVSTCRMGGNEDPDAALDVLEKVGLSEPPDSMVCLFEKKGGRSSEDGRLLFPRALVEDAIAGFRRDIVLHGQRPGLELELTGTRVYVGTGGAAPAMGDVDTGAYRPSQLSDLYDAARVADALDNIHFS